MAKAKAGSLASLRNQAKRLKIAGRSSMNKAQLQAAVDRAKASSMKFPARKKKKLSPTRQEGSSNPVYDRRRKALPPGKRVSKKTGNVYYERRRNRSDRPGQLLGNYSAYPEYEKEHLEDAMTHIEEMVADGNDVYDAIHDYIELQLIYNYSQDGIIENLARYMPDDWSDTEFGPLKNKAQLAYVTLHEFLNENLDLSDYY